jgi:hypothetical protein
VVLGGGCVEVVEPSSRLFETALVAVLLVHTELVWAVTITTIIGDMILGLHVD